MIMNENQTIVLNWWYTGKDYQQGILLLSRFCKNKILAAAIAQKAERFGRNKLEYELPKSVNLNYLDMPEFVPSTPPLAEPVSGLITPSDVRVVTDKQDPSSYPDVIKRLKHEYSELYNQRSIAHKDMMKIPETNNPENNKNRSVFLDQIKTLSLRMDMFYQHIEKYEKDKLIPDPELIWPVTKEEKLTAQPPLKPELITRRKLLVVQNYRDNNRLKYSVKEKLKEPNPLPPGPKRNKIIASINSRNLELDRINILLKTVETNANISN